ncbi:MAG: sugar phosphate nucleotidyltransferase [Gemmataceae bacterium]
MIRAVIQAGGKGTRLYPYTTVLPKPLMPIDETPILEIIVSQLVNHGFRDLTVTIGSLGHLIMAVLGDGSRFGARIDYLHEKQPRGTIGALSGLGEITEPILVLNGDLLTDFNFRQFMDAHCAGSSDLTVCAFNKEIPLSLGVFKVENGQAIGFYEKPVLSFPCNMGIYALNPRVLSLIPAAGPYGFDDLMAVCLERKVAVRVHPFEGLWMDIGRPEDYASSGELFRKNRDRLLRTRSSETLTRLPLERGEPVRPPFSKVNLMETISDS